MVPSTTGNAVKEIASLQTSDYLHYAISYIKCLNINLSVFRGLINGADIRSYPTSFVLMGYPAGVNASTGYCYAPSFVSLHWGLF